MLHFLLIQQVLLILKIGHLLIGLVLKCGLSGRQWRHLDALLLHAVGVVAVIPHGPVLKVIMVLELDRVYFVGMRLRRHWRLVGEHS